MGKSLRIGQVRRETPASGYIAWYPGMQKNTDTEVTDRSGNANHLTKSASATWNNNATTGIWETANYFSSQESATAYWTELLNAAFAAWDYSAGDSLLLAWRGLITTPAGTSRFLGNTGTASIGLCARAYVTTGLADFQLVYGAGPTVITLPAAGGTATAWGAGSPSEAHYAIAIDGALKKFYAFKDGVVDANVDGLTIGDGVTAYDFRAPSSNFKFGGAASTAGISASFRDFHVIRKAEAGFKDLTTAVAFLANSRFLQLPERLL